MEFGPDLIFVEFAVNDSNKPAESIIRSMEGIVHQVRRHDPTMDICFIYTIKEEFLETEREGELPHAAATMEQIAEENGIPSINFGAEVCRLLDSRRLVFKGGSNETDGVPVFSRDGVHPYPETGHKIYFGVLERSLEKMIAASQSTEGPVKHRMGGPVKTDALSNAGMFDLDQARLSRAWQTVEVNEHPSFGGFSRS